jgi:alcohol dehydrogenase class IV
VVTALLLPAALRFNAGAAVAGYRRVATALGSGQASGEGLAATFAALFDRLGLPRRLRELGVARAALPELAALAMEDWFMRGNPRPVRSPDELEPMLEAAW